MYLYTLVSRLYFTKACPLLGCQVLLQVALGDILGCGWAKWNILPLNKHLGAVYGAPKASVDSLVQVEHDETNWVAV